MRFPSFLLICLALLVADLPLLAGGKAGDDAAVSFHVETEATDNPKMIFEQQMPDGKARFFRRAPEFGTKDIVAFSPFPAEDQVTYGLAIKLSNAAAQRLAAISAGNQGRFMVARVNGRIVDAVIIDKPVNDGFLIIWSGVTDPEIKLYDKKLPRLDALKDKQKKK